MLVKNFAGDNEFMSNFNLAPIDMGDYTYQMVESALVGAMTDAEPIKKLMADTKSGTFAVNTRKGMGGFPEDFNIKAELKVILTQKYQNEELQEKLLDTGDAYLLNSLWWHDNVLGACNCKDCKDKNSQNLLGTVLMEIRDELRGDVEEEDDLLPE